MTSLLTLLSTNKGQITQFPLFLLFLVLGISLYYLLRRPKILLFVLSYLFYASFSLELSVFVLCLSTLNYFMGSALYKYRSRLLLVLGIVLNVSALAYFKYLNFIILNLFKLKVFNTFDPVSDIVLPLGISFFVFEFLHYIVDIYRGYKPVKSLLDFYVFSFFFPTQIAGPIKRFEDFMPQLKKKPVDYSLLASGIDLIVLGLFKKLVLANALSFLVTRYFTESYTTQNILGVYAFCFQIYFDFSGYSDIGRGAAALLNIKVPVNFANPYLSKSIPEFWRRWHITLMDWLRDYVYIPLGGSRKGKIRRAINIVIVFFVSGLWHGAAYHFILWGLYNALLMLISIFLRPSKILRFLPTKISGIICWFVTFNLITFGWVLFRAPSDYEAKIIIGRLLAHAPVVSINRDILFTIILLCLYGVAGKVIAITKPYKTLHMFTRGLIYASAVILIVINLSVVTAPFIYFQF